MKIGVLAAQGAFIEHEAVLKKLGVAVKEVRLPADLDGLDGLIIPGGESTTMVRLMNEYQLTDKLKELIKNGFPVFGTCAGMILLAKKNSSTFPEPLGVMDIIVKRNAFGRQIDSFETDLPIPVLGKKPFHAVFIRAPLIEHIDEKKVDVLARLENGTIVAARQGKLLVSSFHPELTDDTRFHQYFLDIVSERN